MQITKTICDAVRDLVPFVQFKERDKHPRRTATFSKVAGQMHHFHQVTTALDQSRNGNFFRDCQKKFLKYPFSEPEKKDLVN